MEVEKSAISTEGEDTEMDEGNVDEIPKSKQISSSDSEASDSEDEAEQNEQLLTLESELSTNPSNYDSHVQYIKLLRKSGEIEKLREARENMNALFPLSPVMWIEWAKDEASLSNQSDTTEAVEKLFERGVSEYLSIPLWCEYLNYVQEHDPKVQECSADGISKARNLFERAVTAAALHVAQGSQIWDAYAQFEQAILLTIDQSDSEAREKQVQRIRSIFHRYLSVPLANLKSTLLAYKSWEVEQGNALDAESDNLDGVPSHVASAYKKAEEMYNARAHLEEQISRQDISESEKFQHYMSYLQFEKSSGDPARVQILYERAITDFPVSSDLWLDYTRYLDKTLKAGNIVKDVYSRATRNCPWVGDLWVRYLLCLEQGHASEKEISAVFEKSLLCSFSTFEEYLDLFLTRVDGLRRRISSAREDGLNYSLIRESFQKAADYLSPHMKNSDGFLRLHSYWARLELKLGNDLSAARGVWESLLKTCGSMLEAWQAYIAMEVELGNINEARAIYKRCYSKRFSGTGSEDICHAWLRFEREFGTLEDLNRAMQKVTPRLEELQLFRLQQETKSVAGATDQREQNLKTMTGEKRKSGLAPIDEQSPAKQQKSTSQNQKKIHEKKNTQGQNLAESNVNEEKKGKVEKQVKEQQTKGTNPSKTRYTDQCTAFLSNLSVNTKDEDLREFFSDIGGVTAIRIVNDRFTGKSRGLAYVDFEDDEHLAAAVAKNKQMLHGKRLSIRRSDPKQGKKGSIARTAPGGHDGSSRSGTDGSFESKETVEGSKKPEISQSAAHKRAENIELKGRNTFATPRNVRALGWSSNASKSSDEGDEKPKSNDEFRKMFMKN